MEESSLIEAEGCSNTASPVVSPGKVKISSESKLNIEIFAEVQVFFRDWEAWHP